jgi:hypothetical protein
MGVDLNGLVSKYLTPQLVSQIASTAGVDPDSAQKLIGAAVPAVLASLGGALAAPGGAKKISDAVSNSDPDLLTKLTGALGAGQLQTLNDGANALGGLIGAGGLSNLANALGQYAGVPPEAAQSALGAVSQAVIGVIGQQDPSTWSDPSAIVGLIASQKGAIAAALPASLSQALGAPSLLAGLGASSAASGAAPAAPPAGGSGLPTWAIVLIVVVVLAAVAYYWLAIHKKAEKPAAGMAPATTEFAMLPGVSRVG